MPERLPPLPPQRLDDAQRALYESVVGSPRAGSPGRAPLRDEQGRLNGPFNALLYSPRIGQAVQELGTVVRYGSGLTPRAREISILEVARHTGSAYEWSTHVTAALAAGLTADEIAWIEAGTDAATFEPGENAVRSVVRSLLATGDLPDRLYASAEGVLGEALIVELVVLVGYYQLLAMLLRVARVPAPAGTPAADGGAGADAGTNSESAPGRVADGLRTQVSGTGPDVLLLHSLALNSHVWDPAVERSAHEFRLIRPDFPGHGESAYDGRPLTVFELADLAVDELDRLGVARADVVGVSLGGSVAMALALRHPRRVRRLALADCSADYGPRRVADWADRAYIAAAEDRTRQFARQKQRWFSDTFLRTRPEAVARFEAMFVCCDGAAHAATCGALGTLNLLDELAGIAAPTLVVVGGDDPGTPVAAAEQISARIPGARLEVVPGLKHMALFEDDGVWDTILDHLRGTR